MILRESWESIVGLLNTYLRQDLVSMDYRLQSLFQIRQKLEDLLNRKRVMYLFTRTADEGYTTVHFTRDYFDNSTI